MAHEAHMQRVVPRETNERMKQMNFGSFSVLSCDTSDTLSESEQDHQGQNSLTHADNLQAKSEHYPSKNGALRFNINRSSSGGYILKRRLCHGIGTSNEAWLRGLKVFQYILYHGQKENSMRCTSNPASLSVLLEVVRQIR